jgi:hypothetical protein
VVDDTLQMDAVLPHQKVDLSQRPVDAIGREGATISFMYTFPIDRTSLVKTNENYEFLQVGDQWKWARVDHT